MKPNKKLLRWQKTALSGFIFATMAEQLTLLQSGNWHRSKILKKKIGNPFGEKFPFSKINMKIC